jgi:plasmid stabilization system protein ParE
MTALTQSSAASLSTETRCFGDFAAATMRRLIVEPRAEREIAVASRWWHRNRQKAPSAFDDDIAAAIDEVRIEPGLGVSITGTRRANVRRVTLQRVRYYIYYRVNEGFDQKRQ